MTVIIHFYHRCRLSLLRLRMLYLANVIHRAEVCYRQMLSRALYQLSVLEWQYSQSTQRYFAAKSQKGDDKYEL